jgi:hypothetical protein
MSVQTASGGKADWQAGAGTSGTFINIPEVRKWDLTVTKESRQYASSSTAGGKQRIAGAEDFSGSLTLYTDRTGTGTNDASFDITLGIKGGAIGALKLWEDGSAFFIAPSYIDSVAYEVDIEGDSILGVTVQFSRNGALQYPAA